MTGLDRYLTREILLPFAAGLVFLLQVLLASQVLAQADVLLGAGASAMDLVWVATDLVPHFLGYVLPLAFLLGAVLGTARLQEDREIVAMGSVGISPLRLVRVPVGLGVVAALAALCVGLWLEPAGLRDARQRLDELIRRNISSDVRAGVFYEDLPGLTLYAEETHGGRWRHVLISDRTDPEAPLLALSETGRLGPTASGSGLALALHNGEAHREELAAGEYVAARFGAAQLAVGLGGALSDRNRLVGSPFELGPREILARAREAQDPATARRWQTFFHRRIAGPIAILAFGFLAVPIAALGRGGRAFGYAATLLSVVAYYVLLRTGEGLSGRGALPPWLGPNLPTLAMVAVGALLALKLERRGAEAVR